MLDSPHLSKTDYQKPVSVIVLAAGLSERMGSQNKLLLEVDGFPLIAHTLRTLCQHPFEEVIVVLGHQADLIKTAVEDALANHDKPVHTRAVYNACYQQGQATSIYTGLSALTKDVAGAMVFLADLALINEDDLHALRLAFDKCETDLLVPQYQGQTGNPVILSENQYREVIKGDINMGGRRLIHRYPERITYVDMKNDHAITDIDTPDAYQAVLARLKLTNSEVV